MLSQQNLDKIEDLKKSYPTTQALVLPVLWMVQEEHGYISEESMRYVAGILNVTFGHVLGLVTFYTMFNSKPMGRRHVEVCTNVSCMLRGSDKIVAHLEKRLGIGLGETSKDKKWTLSEVECMGSCGTAPMLAVGEEYYENLTEEKLDRIIAELERE
ncbi:MAG: NADH-quinone oxidoreductase subunit NuoE [Ignavibacteriales bacterium]|nr:NADH-quinone oxidoreductase subunit NuoE [Ignavibacteriales bacterium]